MRKNLYVTCGDLKHYDGWEVIQVIPRVVNNADYCMAVITKDDSDNKATDENSYKAMYEDYKSRCEKVSEIIEKEKENMGYAKYDSCLLLIENIIKNGSDSQ